MLLDIAAGHALIGEYVFMVLCMGAAWMTGRSIASEWKPLWNLALGVLGLGFGTRFLHFALYDAPFLSFSRYVVDTAVLAVVAYIGYLFTRTNQMTRQYHWQYEKASPISWREKT
jgi:small-conductance mechanosensitive channel